MSNEVQQAERPRLPPGELERMRRTRRHPRPTQFDGLHLRHLVDDIEQTLSALPGPVNDVVDVFCGTRPYEDLLPTGARVIGYDIDNFYGGADVTGFDFLPFDDESFDLVVCFEGFHYVEDPVHGVSEIRRVLRPGGTALITIPLIWEYDRELLEHRYTGPELAHLFAGWDDVRVTENGGRAVAWALLTNRLLVLGEDALPGLARRLLHPLFALAYLTVNLIGDRLDRIERTRVTSSLTLPMNLSLTARKPPEQAAAS